MLLASVNTGELMCNQLWSALVAISIAGLLADGTAPAFGQSPSSKEQAQVTAKLLCGPHSSDPRRLKAFQALVPFTITQGRLEGSRKLTSNGGGHEDFSGSISSELVLVSGNGSFASGGAWIYQFTGIRRRDAETVLSGRLENTLGGVGGRQCTLRFLRNWPSI
jgi:hypothetical protein